MVDLVAGRTTVWAGLGLSAFLAGGATLTGLPPGIPQPIGGALAGLTLLELVWQADLRPRMAWNDAGIAVLAPFGYPRTVRWEDVEAVAVGGGTVRILTRYSDVVRFDFLPWLPRLPRLPRRVPRLPLRLAWGGIRHAWPGLPPGPWRLPPAPWRRWPAPVRSPVPVRRPGRGAEQTRLVRDAVAQARAAAKAAPSGRARPPRLVPARRPWWTYLLLTVVVLAAWLAVRT